MIYIDVCKVSFTLGLNLQSGAYISLDVLVLCDIYVDCGNTSARVYLLACSCLFINLVPSIELRQVLGTPEPV
jgi:hypothetical protein